MTLSVHHLSVFIPFRDNTISLVIRSYFDGSLTGPYLTLGGFAGSIAAWKALYGRWNLVVDRWLHEGKPHFDPMHMSDAFALRGQFTEQNGWTNALVNDLVDRLFRNCLGPICFEMKDQMRACVSAGVGPLLFAGEVAVFCECRC